MGLSYKIRRFAHDDDAITKALRPFNKHKKIEKKIHKRCNFYWMSQYLQTAASVHPLVYPRNYLLTYTQYT